MESKTEVVWLYTKGIGVDVLGLVTHLLSLLCEKPFTIKVVENPTDTQQLFTTVIQDRIEIIRLVYDFVGAVYYSADGVVGEYLALVVMYDDTVLGHDTYSHIPVHEVLMPRLDSLYTKVPATRGATINVGYDVHVDYVSTTDQSCTITKFILPTSPNVRCIWAKHGQFLECSNWVELLENLIIPNHPVVETYSLTLKE